MPFVKSLVIKGTGPKRHLYICSLLIKGLKVCLYFCSLVLLECFLRYFISYLIIPHTTCLHISLHILVMITEIYVSVTECNFIFCRFGDRKPMVASILISLIGTVILWPISNKYPKLGHFCKFYSFSRLLICSFV